VPELQDRGLDPYVATLRHRGRHYEALRREGVPTQFIGMRSRMDIAGIARAYRLWRLRPDVVVTSSVDAQVIGHLIAVRAGVPHVTIEHGGRGLPRALHRRLLVRMVAPSVDRVIAVSATQLDELRQLGFRTDRIMVIPNGIPAPGPSRPRAAMRAELGIGDDGVLALLVATLRREKRAEVFVEALRRARTREPRLRGAIAGGGPQLELVRTLAGATPDLVHVLGERSDVADLINAADIVCLTSDFEGLPVTVLEAMALSRPLVATRVGGIPDAVAEGRTGKLVAPGDPEAFAEALIALAKAPAVRRSMGDAARTTYQERYTLEAMVERYVALLADLAGGPSDSGSVRCAPTRSGDSSHA
jgi:glycosyltransferase involved in cell wall biosynthesis